MRSENLGVPMEEIERRVTRICSGTLGGIQEFWVALIA
jgi:hypothetical protein